ncbi:restriction endonuclease subunit S [Variovorax sp. VaC1]|uniref:restriction endonuclease subunit S n=1 Tax=Variovorax sp. VaC1 TaxID=3373132 RepID=UPI003748E738
MSLPRYPHYKDSDSWLEQVPSDWDVARLMRVASVNDGVLPESTEPSFELEYVDIGSVSLDRGVERTERMAFSDAPSRARRLVEDGDILVSTVRTYLKAIAPVANPPENLVVSTGFAVVRPHSRLASGYAKYALQATGFVDEVISRSTGVSYPAINASDLVRICVPIPPPVDQTTIAVFLDRETAKIDALIAEQEKLITLLAEKRQATISHAVTRGLSPNAPIKDSGVTWLGKVPANWEALALKHLCELLKDGTHLPPARVEEGVPLLSVRNIDESVFGFREDDSRISADDYAELCRAFVPQAGDVLMATVGATLGKVAIVPDGLGRFHIQRSLAIFRTRAALLPQWLFYCISSDAFQRQLWERVGFSAQPGIYLGTIQSFKMPVPDTEEQRAICAFLDAEVARLDQLKQDSERGVSLLKERRSALIAAAVTGQIDVRGAIAAEAIP